jgi:hypothetical protein
MLSKLAHFSGRGASFPLPEPKPQDLEPHLGAPLFAIRPVTGGTLGTCYRALLLGRQVFLKTHSHPEGRLALLREARLLAFAYPGVLSIRSLELSAFNRAWLVCDCLEESRLPRSLACISELVGRYQHQLRVSRHLLVAESFTDFKELLNAGREALGILTARLLLRPELTRWLDKILDALHEHATHQPRILCHGDLGPRNILQAATKPVAIDWEDSFWGIQGYDELYWLSFMENMHLLRAGWNQVTALEPELEKGLLGVVVLLKSRLAIDSGAFRQHKVTGDRRLAEIAGLPLPRPLY